MTYKITKDIETYDDKYYNDSVIEYEYHYQQPDYNSWDSDCDYYGEDYIEIIDIDYKCESIYEDIVDSKNGTILLSNLSYEIHKEFEKEVCDYL